MDKEFRELYDLIYSPIVTPYNLVDNAKLENYKSVVFEKGENGLVVSMECSIDTKELATFTYYFDLNDHLQKVLMESSIHGREILFNRKSEIGKTTEKLIKKRYKGNRKAV